MQIRHRIPTIFNLSMVDVLCCALGCVILLWLLNLREAKERAATVGETSASLRATQTKLEETATLLESARQEREQLGRDLKSAQARVTALDKEVAGLQTQKSAAEERLAKLTREQQILTKEKVETGRQLQSTEKQLQDLEKRLRDKEKLADASARRMEELVDQLSDAESRTKKLQAEMQGYRSQLTAAELKALEMETVASARQKELATAGRSIDQLQREKQSLAEQANRARTALENRFEGIMLTGRRVIFLVDMSGSMDFVDERTPDANKWLGVREALAKVMRSLSDLEKFQVILFSDRISYLLGSDGAWLDFDAKTSPDRVLRALAAIKPRGSTNMYDPFEAAFRLRSQGLDTIYVFSDGLPNDGPGLTTQQANTLGETERSTILAKYIRNLLGRNWNREITGRPRVRINTIGFFYESPDVGAFLWALARENDGGFVGMSKP
jgi:hypothetical protein